jgi:uncharacterized protein (DUF302 family)
MPSMTKKARQLTGKAAAKARKVLATAERQVGRRLRKRRVKRVIREATEAAAITGAVALTGAAMERATRRLRRPRTMEGPSALEIKCPLPYDVAVTRVTDALRAEGFGVLTRIDADRVFHEKLGAEFRPFTILGACNPGLAIRALTAQPEMGLYLPCNVTVERSPGGGCVVRIASPRAMLDASGFGANDELRAVAVEAEKRMARTAEWLREHGNAAVL